MHPWTYYLEKTRKLLSQYKNPTVLKTDCNNEAYARPMTGGIAKNIDADVTLLEYDKSVIKDCLRLHPEMSVIQGDIRKIPFDDESFDVVLDLSTLDHIPWLDVENAVKEYHRVTRGHLLLIVWYGNEELVESTNQIGFSPENQYYFDQNETKKILNKYFVTEEEDFDFYKNNKSWLGYHLLRKK